MNAPLPHSDIEVRDALLRASLAAFSWKAFETLHRGSGEKFIPNWHIKAICQAADEARRGRRRKVVITMPPRHSKSTTIAVAFSAFVLGHEPGAEVIVASYSLDLARKHAEDCRRIMESAWYRQVFPGTRIAPGSSALVIKTTAGGRRKGVSTGSATIGFGADYIIVDDLLSAADAASETERDRANVYLDGSLLTRLNEPATGRVICIQQRLHENDPAGHLLAKGAYRHLNLPAIAEEDEAIPIDLDRTHLRRRGEALFPQRFDIDVLEGLRRELGSATFAMQYQQNPIAPEGSALRWEWFGTYDDQPPRRWFQHVVQSWDTGMSADPKSDYSVCTTWGFREDKWYLLAVFRDRLDYPDLRKTVLRLAEDWSPDKVLIEKAATGIPLLHDHFHTNRALFRAISPVEDKEIRFNAACAPVEDGRVVLPRAAPWLAAFKKELLGFPRTRHDDQADSFSQFLNWATGPGFRRMDTRRPRMERPHMRDRPRFG